MAKFILIDPLLIGIGGHHYSYASDVLEAAEAAGYQVVLATSRNFRERDCLPAQWRVLPVFRYSLYGTYADLRARQRLRGRDPDPSEMQAAFAPSAAACARRLRARLSRRWSERRERRESLRRNDVFARTCVDLLRRVGLARGDHVFLPTFFPFNLPGLVQCLTAAVETRLAEWHVQFQFNLLDGREGDYAGQEDSLHVTRTLFRTALARMPQHRVHLYTPTDAITAQYDRLGVASFQTLPYPVSPRLTRPRQGSPPGMPLRVTCAGALREEKGKRQLPALLRGLHRNGRRLPVQLVVQSKPKHRLRLGLHRRGGAPDAALPEPPVAYADYPLDRDRYLDFVRSADIGMFLYDGAEYYARCSGVLVEMLAAGVPVIVPAGSWLAEQIAEPLQRHIEQLRPRLDTIHTVGVDGPVWPAGSGSGPSPAGETARLTIGGKAVVWGEASVPAGATNALVAFRWIEPREAGIYVCLRAEQYGSRGELLDDFPSVVGPRANGEDALVLLRLHAAARGIRLVWTNAYDSRPVTVSHVEIQPLSAATLPGGSCPLGAVGLIAARHEQFPALLEEMVAHYDHYRSTASAFSRKWFDAHDPKRTLARLVSGRECWTAESPAVYGEGP